MQETGQPAMTATSTSAGLFGVKWLELPEEHDYPAAESYLNLIYDPETAARFVRLLKAAPVSEFKSKDIFRASGLSLLGVSNSHVGKNIEKMRAGKALSPLLLVRDKANGKVVIADGYHRMCAVYTVNEDALIPCKIA
jgi:disulfide oxidoreductase YuzD